MSSSKFGKFFGGGSLPKKNQTQKVNSDNVILDIKNSKEKGNKGYFRQLVGIDEEKKYIQEIAKNSLDRIAYFSNHSNIFYKFTDMSEEAFKNYIIEIKKEVEVIMNFGSLKEINQIKMLNNWLLELEKLLDKQLLHPLDQQCQEMYSLLLRHVNKSQSFNASSPDDFRIFLRKIRETHRIAKDEFASYFSGEADISVKDSALTKLREINDVLRSLRGALNKQLSKVRESANRLQTEFDQSYHSLLQYVEEACILADEEPEEFRNKLDKIKNRRILASSQIEKYLSGTDSNEEKKRQAFKLLEKSLIDIKEIEKNLTSVFDVRSRVDKTTREIQQSYQWLFEYTEQSQYFAKQDPENFKKNLKRLRADHKHACSCIEKYLSGNDRDEANYFQALKKLEKSFGEMKRIELQLDTFLLNKLNSTISQTYNKLLEHINQSPRFTSLQLQNFIEDLKDIDRKREQAISAIETSLIETDVNQKKSKLFKVLEEIELELASSLVNEINSQIMHRCNYLDKYQESINVEERERDRFKERLERIEKQRKDANAKLEPYFSRNDISEEDKYAAFEMLEECLEKTKAVEIDMTPFLKSPLIQKIDQSYSKLVQGESKSPIFTKQELQELNQVVANIKEYIMIGDKDNKDATYAYQSFKEDFDKLSKLERKIFLYLRLQLLHNSYLKISSSIEKYLNNSGKFDSEERKKIRKSIEQIVIKTKTRFENVKKILQEDHSPMRIEYLGELSLNEYQKSIESLRKQASQMLRFIL